MLQIREEVGFTKGGIFVRSKLVTRSQANLTSATEAGAKVLPASISL
jgi:hypothetical protein